jgi:PAS domain S-box-containing protein
MSKDRKSGVDTHVPTAAVRLIRASPLARYGIALGAATAAILLRLTLDPVWGITLPYITLFPAIMLSAWLGGLWPGIVTTVMSAGAAMYFWVEPSHSWAVTNKSELLGMLVFVAIGVVISALNEASRRAVAGIAESEERLRITLAGIGDAVITTDEQGRVTRLNLIARALTGWTEAEALGRSLSEVFVILNEQSRTPAENPVPRVLRDGIVATLGNHTILVSRTGREIPVDDSAAPIKDADGSIVGAVLIFRDVTERRRREQERATLLENEHAARLEAERLSQELLRLQGVTDIALTNLEPSALMRELLGRVCTALQCDSASVLLLEPDGRQLTVVASHGLRDGVVEALPIPVGRGVAGRIVATRRAMIVDDLGDVEVVDAFLRQRLTSLMGAPLEIGERVIGVIHVGTVAERRFAENDLRLLSLVAERLALTIERTRLLEQERMARIEAATAEQQLRLALEAGRMGTWEWTIATGNVKWSAGLEAIHGLEPGTFPGTFDAVQEEIHSDDRESVIQAIANAVNTGQDHHVEYRIIRSDGEIRWVEGIGRIFRDATGAAEHMTGVCSDITQRKQAEQALKDADHRKDEFLAVLSHELRNPINAVIGWAQMLRSGSLPAERATQALEIIERNARAEAQMIESLLDLSRITAGKLELNMTRVDLASVVEAAAEAARPVADAKAVTLDVVVSSSPAFIVGDGARLHQVLSNLLSNALKFTPAGGRVQVQLAHSGSRYEIQIVDDGEGISPEFLPFVFDRFRQAGTGKERRHGGLGLGLAIVWDLVHAQGGNVTADSAGQGKGSVFTVTLPARAMANGEPEATDREAAALSIASVAAVQILVVDDEQDARQLLAVWLESGGAYVTTASSAAEALSCLTNEDVQVLVADIGMPDEDGYTLIRKLREHERAHQQTRLPPIAVTAYAAAHDRDEALSAGYDVHLPKPVDRDVLLGAIRTLVTVADV